jgi:cytochrome c biogenesis protein
MENTGPKKKGFIDRIWDFFASVKLAAVIFGFIALSSIIGTILEQQSEPEKNLKLLARMFGSDLAPTLYNIFDAMGFMDMYHSWWFILFLVIFSTNLIVCSLERIPTIVKVVKQPLLPLPSEKFGAYPIKKEFKVSRSADSAKEPLRIALRKSGFSVHEVAEGGTVQFYSQKGAYSRLGVYVTHLSVLVILLGAVIGIFFGFNGYLNLPEGYSSDVAYSRRGGNAYPLGFSVRCDDFDVEYYRNTDMPQDYKSWLTIFKNGQEVEKQMIEVNHPLTYEGYTFYQSSFGLMPELHGTYVFNVTSKTGKSEIARVEPGGSFSIPGTDITGKVADFSPALAFRPDSSTYTYSEMMTNPAVFVNFFEKNGKLYSGWILKRFPKTWDLPDGNRVEFIDFWGAQYTGMQVRKDPGVWIVYLGCIIIAVGLYSAFFMSHRKIWVSLVPESKDSSRVMIAATANKNRPAFERKIEHIIANVTKKN